VSLSAEVQAFINEIEAQRNVLGARAAKYAAEVCVLKNAVEERDATITALRADLTKRDNQKPEDWG
jgi:hypothetical protein